MVRAVQETEGNGGWMMSIIVGLTVSVVFAAAASAEALHWMRLDEGLAISVWEPRDQCHEEVAPVVLIKVDPVRYRFATFHYRNEGMPEPVPISEWQQRTGAAVVFNAGQFLDDYSYLGLLLKDGRSIGGKRHRSWRGLFVAEPVAQGSRRAGILDLASDEFSEERPAYREVAQSLMLLDRQGKARVKRSGKLAQQTVVAELQDGNILLVKTTADSALWDLAECLKVGLPEVRQALAFDGGSSSDLLVADNVLKNFPGLLDAAPWSSYVNGSGRRHIPLPSVIAVFPREK